MLSYNNVGWTDQNLAGVSPNSGSPPISRRRTTNNTSSIWGISLDPCAPTLLQRQRLADEDLTVETGAPAARGGTITGFSVQNYSYVYYTDYASSHLHQMLYNNIDWTDIDLTAITGGPAAWAGSVVAFTTTRHCTSLHGYGNPAHSPDIQYQRHELQDQDLTDITRRHPGVLCSRGMAGSTSATIPIFILYLKLTATFTNSFTTTRTGPTKT